MGSISIWQKKCWFKFLDLNIACIHYDYYQNPKKKTVNVTVVNVTWTDFAVFKCVEYILTHWGWDRMGTILQTSFSIHFLERKFCYIDGNFMESISALAEEMQTWRRLLRHAIDLQDLQFRCFCGSSGLHVPQSFRWHWKLLSAKQVTGHYLNQCWSRIVIQDITVTRPQWFNPVVLTLLTKLHFHCFSKVWSMASKVHIHACGITMPGPWAVIQVCSTPLCMVQCTHLITTGGTPHLYNKRA